MIQEISTPWLFLFSDDEDVLFLDKKHQHSTIKKQNEKRSKKSVFKICVFRTKCLSCLYYIIKE